ncbi:MAG: redoxin domain-containing protein [Lawsonibacter sp.]
MLEVGTRAPAFTLPDKNGAPVSLSDFQGRKVVLYFYPRDNTPGCTGRPAPCPALRELNGTTPWSTGISRTPRPPT